MVKATTLVAGSILVFGVLAFTKSMAKDGLYHGAKVNTAVEQRQDRWWQEAHDEVPHETSRFGASVPTILYHGDTDVKEVALTFDDGPHPGKVEALLTLMRELNVKATFFVVGKMVEKHPELVQMEAAQGDEIEDHSFSHVNLSKIPEAEAETEYLACKNLLEHVLKQSPHFCRPPGGQATPQVIRAAERCGLTTAMWSDDPKDYSNPGPDEILQRTLEKVTPGGIILLHEGVEETMQILPNLVNTIRNNGYRFVTMSQLTADLEAHSSTQKLARMRL